MALRLHRSKRWWFFILPILFFLLMALDGEWKFAENELMNKPCIYPSWESIIV